MSLAKEEDKNQAPNFTEKAMSFKFDLKALFLPIMQKNRRSMVLGALLMLFHFICLFALQIRSSDFPMPNGLMPSIHFVLSKFNILFLISDAPTRIIVMLCIFGFNIVYFLSMILLGFLSHLPRKHLLRVILTKFHVYCFQVYNWSIMVFSIHVSSNNLTNDACAAYCQICVFINICFTICIANFIEYARININFKCEDSLDSRIDLIDRIMVNFKIFVAVSAGVQFYIDYWLLLLFLLLLLDYLRKVNYYIEKISQIYLSCISCFMFCDILYFGLYRKYFNMQMVDISYVLFFGCSFLLKTALQVRGFLIIHKLKRIAKNGIKTKLDFDLYIRETYANFHNFTTNLEAKILFLSFFTIHQNRCYLKECICKTIIINNQTTYFKTKKSFKKVIESYFIEYLDTVKEADFEDVFLMYCSFVTNILKIPSKALKLLIINKNKIPSLKNRILVEILVKKSKKSLEKKLLNNDGYAQSFSSVIFFDHQIRTLESDLKHVILNELKIGAILLNEFDSTAKLFDSFVEIGSEVNISIEKSKEKAKKLFDLNVNNLRLIQLTTLIIKYLSEDMSFRNFYKQLNIKRINQAIQKRKKKDLCIDLFDNDGGVIFISLGKNLGCIKKFSKNLPKIFGCDSSEMKNKNINEFMPLVFSSAHNTILNNFVNTGKATLLVSKITQLYGLTKENLLLHLHLIMRLDTFFMTDFLIGAFIKTMKNTMSKTILIDIHGNFINCSKEVTTFLNLHDFRPETQQKVSMILLIPDIMEKLLPFKFEDLLLKRNTDFKMKGFLLAPIEMNDRTISAISIKDKIYSSFTEFEALEDPQKKFQELRNEVAHKMAALIPTDFKFYRIHFTLIIQNFRSNLVNTRLIEIFDILEIKDIQLQTQYLSRKTKNFQTVIKNEEFQKSPADIHDKPAHQQEYKITGSEIKESISSAQINTGVSPKVGKHNSHLLTIDREEEKIGDSYLSVTNRSDLEKKLVNLSESNKQPSESLLPQKSEQGLGPKSETLHPFNEKDSESEQFVKSESSNQLLKPQQEYQVKTSLSTIEQEEGGSLSFERDGQDFEEKISQMSNEFLRKESDEEDILAEENTHTKGASQASRVSSHASGADGNRSTLDVLIKVGVKKIQYLKILNVLLFILFLTVTIVFFVLIQDETYNLEVTIQNSGIFHNQVAPLCVLVRDSAVIKFLYGGMIQLSIDKETQLINDIHSSIEFNNILLLRAYKTGIAQADSSVDFVYMTFVNITIENVTLYTMMVDNSTDPFIQHQVPIKLIADDIIYLELNVPQCILFFLSAAEHLYYSEILEDVTNATDSYNYIFFLQENIPGFLESMLEVLDTNKQQIGGSVSYLSNLNLAFFLITLFSVLYGIGHSCYISIKSKFKANKFCSLFFYFQEKEIEERSNKLHFVMDRYFDQKNVLFSLNVTSFDKVSNTRSKMGDIISTDKINFLHTENFVKQKKRHRAKKTVTINQLKGRKFQLFLLFFLFSSTAIASAIIGLYLSNYLAVNYFSSNVTEITGDLESVESYVLTLHIQYAANFMLLGLYDQSPERKIEKMAQFDALLDEVNIMQSQITDLTSLFKLSNTDHILTQLKYDFFTNDICELCNYIQMNINSQVADVQEISNMLEGIGFCQDLLKNVLTKGSTSLAFEVNQIFQQWQDFIRRDNFSGADLVSIIQTQEFLDINYALPYIYALGLYDINLMMINSENYFQNVRSERLVWFIITLFVIAILFTVPYQKLIRHLNTHANNCFALIKIFPYTMINNNKMLENKIIRITKQQKI